ncbi:MAG: hypothetical protein CL759_09210 [Chloroflexi bacterium]|nr:hypothetical protein [Chloroflexota bacterium]
MNSVTQRRFDSVDHVGEVIGASKNMRRLGEWVHRELAELVIRVVDRLDHTSVGDEIDGGADSVIASVYLSSRDVLEIRDELNEILGFESQLCGIPSSLRESLEKTLKYEMRGSDYFPKAELIHPESAIYQGDKSQSGTRQMKGDASHLTGTLLWNLMCIAMYLEEDAGRSDLEGSLKRLTEFWEETCSFDSHYSTAGVDSEVFVPTNWEDDQELKEDARWQYEFNPREDGYEPYPMYGHLRKHEEAKAPPWKVKLPCAEYILGSGDYEETLERYLNSEPGEIGYDYPGLELNRLTDFVREVVEIPNETFHILWDAEEGSRALTNYVENQGLDLPTAEFITGSARHLYAGRSDTLYLDAIQRADGSIEAI